MNELTPHDTQPVRAVASDTQPVPIVAPRRTRPLMTFMLFATLIAAAGGALIGWLTLRTRPVTIAIDGASYTGQTRAATVGELLAEQGIAAGDYDLIMPAVSAPLPADGAVLIRRAQPVMLTIDGRDAVVWTTENRPDALLQANGISLNTGDQLWINGQPVAAADLVNWQNTPDHIVIRRAQPFTIESDGLRREAASAEPSVGAALYAAGITLYAADRVFVDGERARLNTPLHAGAVVRVERAAPIQIEVDGALVETRTGGATVADVLAENGIALAGLDYTVPSEAAPITPGMTVRVFRVKEAVITEDSPIPYASILQADVDLELDRRVVLQAGRAGVQRTRIRVRYENGNEVAREVEAAYPLIEARDEIVAYGTNVVIRTLDTPDGPVEYWRTFRVYATSYHPAALGGDNITATGRILQRGIIGADRDLLPFGTEVYVEGYGRGVIADTGPDRATTRWIDLGYSDDDWINWHRWVTIYVLTPVPAEIDYFPPP